MRVTRNWGQRRWLRAHAVGAAANLIAANHRALTQAQEQAIQRTICDKRPEQLKMEFALWSRAAVMEFIKREYAVVLHVRSVGKYLKRWGFTPQKPIKRAYEQSPAAGTAEC